MNDLLFANRLHALASSHHVLFYDCSIFPTPTTLDSFEVNAPSIFLGGEFSPKEEVLRLLYGIGKHVFGGYPNQGVVYRMILSVCEMIIIYSTITI